MRNIFVIIVLVFLSTFCQRGMAQDSTRSVAKAGFELYRSGLLTFEYEYNLWNHLSLTGSAGGFLSLWRKPGLADQYHLFAEARYYWLFAQQYKTEGLYAGPTAGYEYYWERKPLGVTRQFYQFVEFGAVLGGQFHVSPRCVIDGNIYYGWVPGEKGWLENQGFHQPGNNQGQRIGTSLMVGYSF